MLERASGAEGVPAWRAGAALLSLCLASLFLLPAPASAQAGAAATLQPRIIVQTGHATEISAAAWTADGKYLVTGSTDAQILVWDLEGRVIDRIELGDERDSRVVEKIVAAPDGGGAEVDEIEYRELSDNGDASEWHRRHYSIRFGIVRAEAVSDERIEPPAIAESFAPMGAVTADHKMSLFLRDDWPRSPLGWTLKKRTGGELTMLPPSPGAAPIGLAGPLGPDRSDTFSQMDAMWLRLERARRDIDSDPAYRAALLRECVKRPDCNPDFPVSDLGPVGLGGEPMLSPTGSMLAWVDMNLEATSLHVLDLELGRSHEPFSFDDNTEIDWIGAATLAARGGGTKIIDLETHSVSPTQSEPCAIPTAGELGTEDLAARRHECAPDGQSEDARRAARLTYDKGFVHAADAASGRYLCSAFLDQSEIAGGYAAIASRDASWIALQSLSGYTELFRVPAEAALPPADCGPDANCVRPPRDPAALRAHRCPVAATMHALPGRVGFHPTRPLLWTDGRGGRIEFHDLSEMKTGLRREGLPAPMFTLYRLPGGRFFAIDRKGRYDTNLPADTEALRWTIPDAPLQSLAPQMFMRDYYQPRLMRRLIECAGSEPPACEAQFPPLRPLASLNRVLPLVRITGVRKGSSRKPNTVFVSVAVEDGVDLAAPNGKTRSGVYDVRLFRDGRLVMHHPNQVDEDQRETLRAYNAAARAGALEAFERDNPNWLERRPEHVAEITRDLEAWRRLSRLGARPDGTYAVLDFEVELPTGAGTEASVFSAYAFNEDRVKSDTATLDYRRPPATPLPRRAFVVTIGIDAYDAPRLALNYAAGDARLMAERLAAIPGYEVRRISLEGTRTGAGKARHVTRAAIEILLSTLAGGDLKVGVGALGDMGFDASQLDRVRPDDILIVSFSGHGWADGQGNFYLLPSDADWRPGADAPVTDSLLSSANLAVYLGSIPAAEISLIIDACHSAASVDGGGFRPGPMGDSGLGQLAFDKGIRILAATQADDVALEDAALRQGLLTYALAREGLTETGGKADLDGDGQITLEEWLGYAAKRMPSLSAEVRKGLPSNRIEGTRGWVRAGAGARKAEAQEPALFDFNAAPSRIVLRAATGR